MFASLMIISCSKSDSDNNNQKQDVIMEYSAGMNVVDWDIISHPNYIEVNVSPSDLYQNIVKKLNDLGNEDYFLNKKVVCTAENFNAVIEEQDQVIVSVQNKIYERFLSFYVMEIAPLLKDYETFGKGTFSIKVSFYAMRKEPSSLYGYQTKGYIKGTEINKTFEPISFEIKYSNP